MKRDADDVEAERLCRLHYARRLLEWLGAKLCGEDDARDRIPNINAHNQPKNSFCCFSQRNCCTIVATQSLHARTAAYR